jgi:hypothetical protein
LGTFSLMLDSWYTETNSATILGLKGSNFLLLHYWAKRLSDWFDLMKTHRTKSSCTTQFSSMDPPYNTGPTTQFSLFAPTWESWVETKIFP